GPGPRDRAHHRFADAPADHGANRDATNLETGSIAPPALQLRRSHARTHIIVSKESERPAARTVTSLPVRQVESAAFCQIWNPTMTKTTTLLCAAASAEALHAAPASATPLSAPLAF